MRFVYKLKWGLFMSLFENIDLFGFENIGLFVYMGFTYYGFYLLLWVLLMSLNKG